MNQIYFSLDLSVSYYDMFCRNHFIFISLSVFATLMFLIYSFNDRSITKSVRNFSPTTVDINRVGDNISDIFNCNDKILDRIIEYHGDFLIFNNFVKSHKEYRCYESITISVPADYRFLDNIIPLIGRWEGPISVALYAPGNDFFATLESIAYLRICSTESEIIKKYVTFHLFMEHEHLPVEVSLHLNDSLLSCVQCLQIFFPCSKKSL